MSKFDIRDRVIFGGVAHIISKIQEISFEGCFNTGEYIYFLTEDDNNDTYSNGIGWVSEKSLTLNKQYYRDIRLNKILN